MLSMIDWFQEKIKKYQVRKKFRKYPPKVRALQVLLVDNPNLLTKSAYDRAMEDWFARHPRTRQTTRPTPYPRRRIIV